MALPTISEAKVDSSSRIHCIHLGGGDMRVGLKNTT